MNGARAELCARITRTAVRSTIMMTGSIHQRLLRAKKESSSPAMPNRWLAVLKKPMPTASVWVPAIKKRIRIIAQHFSPQITQFGACIAIGTAKIAREARGFLESLVGKGIGALRLWRPDAFFRCMRACVAHG